MWNTLYNTIIKCYRPICKHNWLQIKPYRRKLTWLQLHIKSWYAYYCFKKLKYIPPHTHSIDTRIGEKKYTTQVYEKCALNSVNSGIRTWCNRKRTTLGDTTTITGTVHIRVACSHCHEFAIFRTPRRRGRLRTQFN